MSTTHKNFLKFHDAKWLTPVTANFTTTLQEQWETVPCCCFCADWSWMLWCSAHLRRFRNQCEQGAGKKGWYVGGRSSFKKNSTCRLKNRYQFVHPTQAKTHTAIIHTQRNYGTWWWHFVIRNMPIMWYLLHYLQAQSTHNHCFVPHQSFSRNTLWPVSGSKVPSKYLWVWLRGDCIFGTEHRQFSCNHVLIWHLKSTQRHSCLNGNPYPA